MARRLEQRIGVKIIQIHKGLGLSLIHNAPLQTPPGNQAPPSVSHTSLPAQAKRHLPLAVLGNTHAREALVPLVSTMLTQVRDQGEGSPAEVTALLLAGVEVGDPQQQADAVALMAPLLDILPQQQRCALRLARGAYLRRNRDPSAKEDFERVLHEAERPEQIAHAYIGLGLIARKNGAHRDAINHLKKALAALPSGKVGRIRGRIHADMGICYKAMGKWASALQHDAPA